jgi:hypothetical protein
MRCIKLDFNKAMLASTCHRMRGYCYQSLRKSSSSFAMFAAIRRAALDGLQTHLQIIQGRELSCGATCSLAHTMCGDQPYTPSGMSDRRRQ